jgi:hypothetical protein
MKLVDEIIEMASEGRRSLADALRKCLILAFDLKNEKLKEWVEKELNGYDRDDEVPEYRKAILHSKGNFQGPFGAWLPQRPLPLAVIAKEHPGLLVSKLTQPIAAHEGASEHEGQPVINWSPDLIARYQAKFIEDYVLVQAWQDVPPTVMIGLCEEVRNRLLRFGLEIREELGHVNDKPAAVPAAKVEAAVVNHIYGGVNVIAGSASDFTQIGNVIVRAGDFQSLANALLQLNVSNTDIQALKSAIEADSKTLGALTKKWLATLGTKLGKAGLQIGVEVATGYVKSWLSKYFGGIDVSGLNV